MCHWKYMWTLCCTCDATNLMPEMIEMIELIEIEMIVNREKYRFNTGKNDQHHICFEIGLPLEWLKIRSLRMCVRVFKIRCAFFRNCLNWSLGLWSCILMFFWWLVYKAKTMIGFEILELDTLSFLAVLDVFFCFVFRCCRHFVLFLSYCLVFGWRICGVFVEVIVFPRSHIRSKCSGRPDLYS